MATAVRIEERIERMDLLSCVAIGGEYDIKSGLCRFKVKIDENGREEYLVKKGE